MIIFFQGSYMNRQTYGLLCSLHPLLDLCPALQIRLPDWLRDPEPRARPHQRHTRFQRHLMPHRHKDRIQRPLRRLARRRRQCRPIDLPRHCPLQQHLPLCFRVRCHKLAEQRLELWRVRAQYGPVAVNNQVVLGTTNGGDVGQEAQVACEAEPAWVQDPTAVDKDQLGDERWSIATDGGDQVQEGADLAEGEVTGDVGQGKFYFGVILVDDLHIMGVCHGKMSERRNRFFI